MYSYNDFVEKLNLEKHPEGGFFKEVYRSDETIKKDHLPNRFNGGRNFLTSIYYLLQGDQISKLHRIKSDEIWHHHYGSNIIIHTIDENGNIVSHKLGTDNLDVCIPQVIVKRGLWFCAEVEDKNSFALCGCTVSPGFDFKDFELGDFDKLCKIFPQHKSFITKFT
ncbi:MAG: cupin domain-containing protein [Melioribacteraceae bacterium]|nr:cupin domain-containing protein [Melioribacteraceae bacterium]MCO6472540.1 cupin domain-containing protein [Melioribacteraceae bacterium]MDD3557669.1 cupin domain-containing protein [Melioribacteraceae bacterium]